MNINCFLFLLKSLKYYKNFMKKIFKEFLPLFGVKLGLFGVVFTSLFFFKTCFHWRSLQATEASVSFLIQLFTSLVKRHLAERWLKGLSLYFHGANGFLLLCHVSSSFGCGCVGGKTSYRTFGVTVDNWH